MVRTRGRMRRGFTLIELLVVIAILAILVSITVPAVFQALVTAERARTVTRMSNLALAINNYALAGGGEYPVGYDTRTGTTFYWAIVGPMGIGAPNGSAPVEEFLCPARRRASTCAPGTAPADYGYGEGSILATGGVTPTAVTNGRGAANCLLLGIIGVKPSTYVQGENDGPWRTHQGYKRSPRFAKDDDNLPMSTMFGGPFPTGLPFAFADRSVRFLRYDRFSDNDPMLSAAWNWSSQTPLEPGRFD